MKLLNELPAKRLIKFGIFEFLVFIYKFLIYPPIRKYFLEILGARIGKNTIIHDTSFFNLYRLGFKGLSIGERCFIGNECMLDLADKIILENDVTLAERVIILTHMNVGYKNHPLQRYFPKFSKPVLVKEGSFIGTGSIILAGVKIGRNSLVAAGSIVTKDVQENSIVGGNPARFIKNIK